MTLLEPIIELVVEFIVVQTIRRGPKMAGKVWRQVKSTRPHLLFVRRTRLVNRERELRTIRAALTEAPYLRILYLSGPGGVGKTRLLEEVAHLTSEARVTIPLYWGGILDLYHADLHGVSTLQNTIIQCLDSEGDYFQQYRLARERFERRRAEGLAGVGLDQERKALDELFLENYNAFAQEHRPVLAFDTLETLIHESDLIQSLCQLKDISIAAYDWLLQQAGRLTNSVFVLASRPQPILRQALEEAHLAEPGQLEIIELSGLTREDSRQLLELFLKNAPPSVQGLRNYVDRLWQLTAGLPVQLALVTELVTQSEHLNQAIAKEANNAVTWG